MKLVTVLTAMTLIVATAATASAQRSTDQERNRQRILQQSNQVASSKVVWTSVKRESAAQRKFREHTNSAIGIHVNSQGLTQRNEDRN